jgi:hypothetical protein
MKHNQKIYWNHLSEKKADEDDLENAIELKYKNKSALEIILKKGVADLPIIFVFFI